jgi:arylsulfatase A
VGRLLKRLEADGDLANTLVLFTSDNGPHAEGGRDFRPNAFASSGPFRGIKRDMYEGGVRVPLIAYWPGKIAAGSTSPHLGAFYDIMPTFAQAAGLPIPDQTDGLSFLPELLGQPQPEHDHLYFELLTVRGPEFRQGIRQGDLKAVRYGAAAELQLFNLKADPGETRNLADTEPEKIGHLESLMTADHQDVPGAMIETR